jgi:fructose-1,6-bisphosphatase/inositol monophosphatase family enzyme
MFEILDAACPKGRRACHEPFRQSRRRGAISHKGPLDLVTEADRAVEALIIYRASRGLS